MRELIAELEAACQDRHPDPGQLPPSFSDWPFSRELNRRAYNQIAADYQENYFANPVLESAFEEWLTQLPGAGKVLDVGCGHGDPVITRLLERGFSVIGSDPASEMLVRARTRFPDLEFWECASTELLAHSAFDGACSFSSMVYLDQVDFFHSLHRLHLALRPGGLLFLYGFDLHPSWRGQPYDIDLGHWMWTSTRSLEETTRALAEHGYFTVLKSLESIPDEERQARIADWRARQQKEHDEWLAKFPPNHPMERTNYSTVTPRLAFPYVIIAQKALK
jgi:SAM-dependent methyltransferase